MAIQFLQDIDLNLAEIKEVVVDSVAGNPGGSGQVTGRIIYETSSNQLRYYNGTAWVGLIADYDRWVLKDNAGTPNTENIETTNTVQFTSSDIDYVVANAGGGTITMTASLAALSPDPSGNYTNANITVDPQGRITTASSGTGGGLSSFDLSASAGGSSTTTTINTTRNDFDIRSQQGTVVPVLSEPSSSVGRLDLSLNYGPSTTANTIITAATAASALSDSDTWIVSQAGENSNTTVVEATLSALKTYVSPGSGGMTFKGGYNASTNTPDIGDATLGVDIAIGDTYVVTAAGSFFTDTVEVGDLIISEVAKSSGDSVALTDYVVVNKNIGLATTTTPGIASFPANSGLTVSGSGEVDITDTITAGSAGSTTDIPVLQWNARGQLTSVTTATAAGGSESVIATNPGSASTSMVYTHNLGTRDVMVQIYDNDNELASYGQTVIADVVRSSTSAVTVNYAAAPSANDRYRVMCVKIG